jgi:ClpP class serine protease
MEIMTDIHADFKSTVRQRRGDRLRPPDDELFEGQIWTGRKAAELGLIDGMADLHGLMRERFGDKVKLPQIGAARPWWRRRFSVGRRDADALALADAVLDGIAARMLWARYGLS